VTDIRLAVDNGVATLPIGNLMDVGGMARELGKRLDDGEFGEVTTVVTLIATDSGLSIHSWGQAPNGYELMGIFECAKLQCFAADADGCE
jgi:hypothetical protein